MKDDDDDDGWAAAVVVTTDEEGMMMERLVDARRMAAAGCLTLLMIMYLSLPDHSSVFQLSCYLVCCSINHRHKSREDVFDHGFDV